MQQVIPSFVTSNQYKVEQIKEFISLPENRRIQFNFVAGVDLAEPMADPFTVIYYKSKQAGDNTVVEDTFLVVTGKPVVDTKYRLEELSKKLAPAQWVTYLAHNKDGIIRVYKGVVEGHLSPVETFDPRYGFDDFFIPDYCGESYSYLRENNRGLYTEYSPRYRAIRSMALGSFCSSLYTHQVKEWTGEWQ